MVQLSEHPVVFSGAAAGGAYHILVAETAGSPSAWRPLCADAVSGVSGLQRPGNQHVAQHHSARHHHMGRFRSAAKSRLCPGRRTVHHPHHSYVHGVGVLRLPGQGASRRGLPLMSASGRDKMEKPWARRVGWLVLLWAAGVATLGLVAWLIRVFMTWAGFSA